MKTIPRCPRFSLISGQEYLRTPLKPEIPGTESPAGPPQFDILTLLSVLRNLEVRVIGASRHMCS